MISITPTQLKRSMNKYLDLAMSERVFVRYKEKLFEIVFLNETKADLIFAELSKDAEK